MQVNGKLMMLHSLGRLVTLAVNGKTVICNQEIPGITGGALDSREGEPGPIMMQGDHGPIEFRNIHHTSKMKTIQLPYRKSEYGNTVMNHFTIKFIFK